MTVHGVLLSGGSGTRLWPLSRAAYPKQLLPLLGETSLLQQTAARSAAMPAVDGLMVVCNEEHRFMVGEQMQQSGHRPGAIVLEPAPRNTAPAVALAALQSQVLSGDADSVILVLPSDHLIGDEETFTAAGERAVELARQGHLVTFGIVPTSPETGYGYIERGAPSEGGAFEVTRFVEKPDRAKAEAFLAAGTYTWNSGMFAFRSDVYLEELAKHRPAIHEACLRSFDSRYSDLDFTRVDEEAFLDCPSESIDYAVMELTDRAVMLPLDAGWNDIGSWTAVMSEGEADGSGNVTEGDAVLIDSERSYVRASDRLVTALGVRDLLVVDTPDALLVADHTRAQDVKKIVAELQQRDRPEAEIHSRVYRPWGSYETIELSERYQVKRIVVNPGERLSLQMHHHRAEHWIVVGGTALVTRDDETFQLTENESTFIPLGARHRLENPGKLPLEMIEVQSGSYLGEDDIVRFEDGYGRA